MGHIGIIKVAINDCKHKETALDSLDAMITLISQLNAKVARLEGKLEAKKEIRTKNTKEYTSYANVTKKLFAPKIQSQATNISPTSKVVIIKPKDQQTITTLEQAKKELYKNFDPKKKKAKIKNVKKTRNDLLIEAETDEDLDKISQNKRLLKRFDISEPMKRRPKLLLYDVPKDMTEDEVSIAVFQQNTDFDITEVAFKES